MVDHVIPFHSNATGPEVLSPTAMQNFTLGQLTPLRPVPTADVADQDQVDPFQTSITDWMPRGPPMGSVPPTATQNVVTTQETAAK